MGPKPSLDKADPASRHRCRPVEKPASFHVKESSADKSRASKIFREGKRVTGLAHRLGELDKASLSDATVQLSFSPRAPVAGKNGTRAEPRGKKISMRRRLPVALSVSKCQRSPCTAQWSPLIAQVDAHKIRSGHLSREGLARHDLKPSAPSLRAALGGGRSGFHQRSRTWRQGPQPEQRQRLSLVIVDYLQLITRAAASVPPGKQVASISRGFFKGLAKEVADHRPRLSQLQPATERERRDPPKLYELRESGASSRDAERVISSTPPQLLQPQRQSRRARNGDILNQPSKPKAQPTR